MRLEGITERLLSPRQVVLCRIRWFRLAAEQGEAIAQHSLGLMYSIGLGVPQDAAEAVRWYRLAAEQGEAIAQLNLGLMYSNGWGVPRDVAALQSFKNKS